MNIIEEIVRKYGARIRDERVLFAPDIPEKKLQNALDDYAQGARGERALALVDNSFFGSAKDGVLLTRKRIYSNEWSSTTFSLELSAIETVKFVERDSSKEIHLNGGKFATLHMAGVESVRLFTQMLDEIRAAIHPTPQEGATQKSRAGKCASCGASYRLSGNAHANCAYCGSHLS